MPSNRRCVFGCVTTGVTIHRFPNPEKFPERFRMWVDLAGDSLKGFSDEQIFKSKSVCDKHFIEKHKNRNNRLNALAVPVEHISRPSTTSTLENSIQSMNLQSDLASASLQITGPSTAAQTPKHTRLNMNLTSVLPCTTMQLAGASTTASKNIELNMDLPAGPSTAALKNTEMDKESSSTLPCTSLQLAGTKKNIPSLNVRYYKDTQRQIRNMRAEICRLKKRCHNFKTRLGEAEKISQTKAFEKVIRTMTLPAKLFTAMQFRETKKKAKGRRFSTEEKILSLALYKRSPKCYTLLSKCFTLPSSKTLKNLIGRIKIGPGINKLLFEKMKNTIDPMSADDRLCTLIFDEMSINPQVHYDAARDELKGFTTTGPTKIADHALVFMVRGIKRKYKQPVAYYFTQNLNKLTLKNVIKDVIKYIKTTGLIIMAMVCDQSTVNVGAVESLIKDTKETYLRKGKTWTQEMMIIEKTQIIPLYDTPHLIKGIRNNLMTKDLKYIDINDKIEKTIKWKYFQEIYEADKSYGELRLMPKICEEHVIAEKINKMKVNTATQLFSHTVAAATKHLVDAGKVESACLNVVPFILWLDKLFDSLNCNTFVTQNAKIYRAGVRRNSPHHELWTNSIKFLKTIKYIEKKTVGNKITLIEKVVPSIKNLIRTIEGFQAIWKVLHNKYKFDIMLCRNFNQDPVENFFGSIRSLGIRNVSPNTVGFEGAYKALLLTNFCSSHSLKSNCEEDMSTFLQSLDFLLTETESKENDKTEQSNDEISLNEEMLYSNENNMEGNESKHYVCGWVLKKCFQKLMIGACQKCKQNLFKCTDDNIMSNTSFIKAKEYANLKWLCYPSNEAVECFKEILNITTGSLKRNVSIKNLKNTIKQFIEIFVNFTIFNCDKHKNDLIRLFQEKSVNVIIYSWCRSINRILCGKINYDGDDEVKKYAKLYYIKHKHNKNKK